MRTKEAPVDCELQGILLLKRDLRPILGRFPFLLPPLRSICVLVSGCFIPSLRFLLKEILNLLLSINHPCHPFEIGRTPSSALCLPLYISWSPAWCSLHSRLLFFLLRFYSTLNHFPVLPVHRLPRPQFPDPSPSCWKRSLPEPVTFFHTFILGTHGLKSRSSYIICKAKCKMKEQGYLVKKWLWISRRHHWTMHRTLLSPGSCATGQVTHPWSWPCLQCLLL